MPKNLLDDIVDKIRNLGSSFKLPTVTTMAAFFVYDFMQLRSCTVEQFSCGGMREFGIIFPFYLVVMPFVKDQVGPALYISLYIVSALTYMLIAYYVVEWIEGGIKKMREKPIVTVKTLQDV